MTAPPVDGKPAAARPLADRLMPRAYRPLFAHAGFRRLLGALAASDLGDGMSMVTVAWLAVQIAPSGRSGLVVGAAVAAYALPGAAGALLFGRRLRRTPARRLLIVDSVLRAVLLGCVPVAWAAGVLHPVLYVGLLAGSSVLHAWGGAGKYALLAEMLPSEHRLAANALVSSSTSAAVIAGPAIAGFLAAAVSPAWLIGFDAASFAVLAVQVGRLRGVAGAGRAAQSGAGSASGVQSGTVTQPESAAGPATGEGVGEGAGSEAGSGAGEAVQPVDTGRSAAGWQLLRRQPELLGVLALTWFFNFLYGPVEVALPLHVTDDLHAGASLLGLYWTSFGAGAVLGALAAGALRRLPLWPVTLGIVAGWGLALIPVGLGVPAPVSLACFALGGVIYGPFTALSYTLFQDRTPAQWLTTVLAARVAALLTAAPVGTALGGPLTMAMTPSEVLTASGAATVALALVAAALRARPRRTPRPDATVPAPRNPTP